ncbi:DUF5808 domain-containing protein [Mucilaginibacter pedocola]|uniref:DUF5808 domain-containing protein n=1 Tax=Mucilaginibacter pedocola TaxID=1792845 RepID=UPI00373FCA2C
MMQDTGRGVSYMTIATIRRLLCPKRFGLGWTFNFVHKVSWLFLLFVAGIAITVRMLAK